MDKLPASIVLLAGALAIGCGTIAEAINSFKGDPAYFVGTILLLVGGWMLLKPIWDAIPVDGGKKTKQIKDSKDEN